MQSTTQPHNTAPTACQRTHAVADFERTRRMTTAELRQTYLLEDLFRAGRLQMVYTDVDRAIVGAAVPTVAPLPLPCSRELAAEFFCERRELGIINIGGSGIVHVDGKDYPMARRDCLYIGRGSREVLLASDDADQPARFYLLSYPSAAVYPTAHARGSQIEPVRLGKQETANVRALTKIIHPAGIPSSQLVMGFTELAPSSVWNTMPPHTHARRSEVYCYFGLEPDEVVFHMMGTAEETRHLVVRNEQVVLSPSWSLHSGVGTSNYAFIWGMGGENQAFGDIDAIAMRDLR